MCLDLPGQIDLSMAQFGMSSTRQTNHSCVCLCGIKWFCFCLCIPYRKWWRKYRLNTWWKWLPFHSFAALGSLLGHLVYNSMLQPFPQFCESPCSLQQSPWYSNWQEGSTISSSAFCHLIQMSWCICIAEFCWISNAFYI